MKIQSNLLGFQKEIRSIFSTTAHTVGKSAAPKLHVTVGGRQADHFEKAQLGLGRWMQPSSMPRLPQPADVGLALPKEFLTKAVEELLRKVFEAFWGALKNNAGANQTSVGGAGNQTSVGGAGNQTSVGGVGNQTSVGGVGNQTSVGGVGNQTSVGGAGNQTSVGSAVRTGLGTDVDALAAISPSLQKDLKQLQQDGWRIQYGTSGAGSSADKSSKVIVLDPALKNAAEKVQVLAHEVGHAVSPLKADYSSKAAYVNSMLADEGAATLHNIKIQREIRAAGGPDIGLPGDPANHAQYNAIYDRYLKDGNMAAACRDIGSIFNQGERASVSGQTYSDYYGKWYDSVYMPWLLGQK